MSLEEPEIVRQGSRYGVRLKASAPSIHLLKADIKTEVAPIVGSEKQSEDLIKYLLDGFEEDPSKIWESNIFGKSLHELVNEGLNNKLSRMPDEAQIKLQETLQKIINEEGVEDEYKNGANQYGTKPSAVIQAYNSMLKNYASVQLKLMQLLPKQASASRLSKMFDDE